MATKYANIKCKVKWTKAYEPDEFAGAKNWKINCYPVDEVEWDKFKKTEVQLTIKSDADGEFFTLRRPTQKAIGDNLVVFAPPEITGKVDVHYVDQNGNKIRQFNKGEKTTVTRVGEQVSIGNDTLVIVNFSYYTTSRGMGHRWEGIRVLDLVEFVPVDESEVDEPGEKVEKKVEVQKDKKTVKKEDLPKPDLKEELNDDLPW